MNFAIKSEKHPQVLSIMLRKPRHAHDDHRRFNGQLKAFIEHEDDECEKKIGTSCFCKYFLKQAPFGFISPPQMFTKIINNASSIPRLWGVSMTATTRYSREDMGFLGRFRQVCEKFDFALSLRVKSAVSQSIMGMKWVMTDYQIKVSIFLFFSFAITFSGNRFDSFSNLSPKHCS